MLSLFKIFKRKFSRTDAFVGMKYKINNPCGKRLKKGDKVIVHPTDKSQAREQFRAEITFEFINWSHRPSIEVCTHVKGKHSAVINTYLFNRLEPVNK